MTREPTLEPLRFVAGALTLLLACGTLLAGTMAAEASAGTTPQADYQLLINAGMEEFEAPYGQWYGVDCQVASGWERFSTGDVDPAWMDTRVFAGSWLGTGWVERIEGETSQLLVAESPYTAGLRQSVTGLVPGVGYGFHAALLTIFRTSAPPEQHEKMVKQVGLDPTGGTDPEAPTVVWSAPNDRDEEWDVQRRVAALAQSSTMTVFIRVDSPYASGGLPYMNLSILDSAILALTPAVSATSPPESPQPSFTVNWNNVEMPPGDAEFKGVDVQWLDEAEGVWHDWLTRTLAAEATFDGELGHRYGFRARAWARYPNDAWLHGPYREEGDSHTQVTAAWLAGRVLSPKGLPIEQATVSISGTDWEGQTSADGFYELAVVPDGGTRTATASHSWWISPPPALDLTFGAMETVPLTWTLLPPTDVVENGHFEEGLAGWEALGNPGAPLVVDEPVHTGSGSLQIGGVAMAGFATGVSQTVSLENAWEPVLSLWYKPRTSGEQARFNVVAEVCGQGDDPTEPVSVTEILTPSLKAGDWRPLWLSAGPQGSAFTGTVRLKLVLLPEGPGEDAVVYIDEVSLGASPGARYRLSLPLILR